VTLKATGPRGSLTRARPITAALRVQACDDRVCLPPATVPIELERK